MWHVQHDTSQVGNSIFWRGGGTNQPPFGLYLTFFPLLKVEPIWPEAIFSDFTSLCVTKVMDWLIQLASLETNSTQDWSIIKKGFATLLCFEVWPPCWKVGKCYPVDKFNQNPLRYPVDSDLSTLPTTRTGNVTRTLSADANKPREMIGKVVIYYDEKQRRVIATAVANFTASKKGIVIA